ncbi:MAG TPA: redoxin family protein [Candidatus Polarisedimenticolia bacterium]|nr:redoxin family protein [Candidatus Polarisedimenticolia bacterium]
MMSRLLVLLTILLALPIGSTVPWEPQEGKSLLGSHAPEWSGITWVHGGPLTLESLKGKVILLRFWMGDCPYCIHSAPALLSLRKQYGDRGLVVVGLHHPKSEKARDIGWVSRKADELGFDFPVGQDDQWTTLRAYGVGTVFRHFTSVSFLIDRNGIIRFVHDGGEFHPDGGAGHEECNRAYEALQAAVETTLAHK